MVSETVLVDGKSVSVPRQVEPLVGRGFFQVDVESEFLSKVLNERRAGDWIRNKFGPVFWTGTVVGLGVSFVMLAVTGNPWWLVASILGFAAVFVVIVCGTLMEVRQERELKAVFEVVGLDVERWLSAHGIFVTPGSLAAGVEVRLVKNLYDFFVFTAVDGNEYKLLKNLDASRQFGVLGLWDVELFRVGEPKVLPSANISQVGRGVSGVDERFASVLRSADSVSALAAVPGLLSVEDAHVVSRVVQELEVLQRGVAGLSDEERVSVDREVGEALQVLSDELAGVVERQQASGVKGVREVTGFIRSRQSRNLNLEGKGL